MYDSFNIADPKELAHKTKSNWTVISQRNNCVRKYEYDKIRFVLDKDGKPTWRTVTSQAFVFFHNATPAYVLHVWPLYRPLIYATVVINQRRAKMGIPPLNK